MTSLNMNYISIFVFCIYASIFNLYIRIYIYLFTCQVFIFKYTCLNFIRPSKGVVFHPLKKKANGEVH